MVNFIRMNFQIHSDAKTISIEWSEHFIRMKRPLHSNVFLTLLDSYKHRKYSRKNIYVFPNFYVIATYE